MKGNAATKDAMTSPRKIGLFPAVALIIGNMVGTSIYVSLGFQVEAGHNGWSILLLWAVGAGIALLGALCYAELASMFPASGGEYQFLRQVYPSRVGFLSGWIALVAGFPAPLALGALAFGQYFMGSVTGEIANGSDWRVKALAVGVLAIVTVVHCFNLHRSSRFQGLFTALKILLLLVLGISGFMVTPAIDPVSWNWEPISDWSWVKATGLFVSLYYVLYAYAGWNAACYISGEVKEPQRNVPRALVMGVGIVFVLYFLVMASFLRATPKAALEHSDLAASLVASHHIFGPSGARIIGACISVALVSFLSSMVWSGPRVAQRMGEDYRFLRPLARTNAGGVPRTAILLQSTLALLFLLLFDDPGKLFLYVEFLLQVSLFLTVLGMMILRHKAPDLPRPVKTWGYPVTPVLFLIWIAFCMSFLLGSRQTQVMEGLVTLLAGMIVHFLCDSEERSRKR